MKHSKRYRELVKDLDKDQLREPKDAIDVVKSMAKAKFDETIDVVFNLGIDPRHADQQLRGTLELPNGTGKDVKVVVVTQSDKHEEAKKAGADFVGEDDIIEKIQGGWFDFDKLIATPNVMSKIGKLGRVLGSKGLMPNPKSGTVSNDISAAVSAFKKGRVGYRNDKYGNIHIIIGKASFDADKLYENFISVYDTLLKAKPSKAKGVYMKNIGISASMSPGVLVEPVKQKWN
ncbi:50S ribosomal protein L1 [Candidatus Marinamargulisbacteria bacterium SCGC AG-410-N11]|nr:50S ribosomal protein L1 [Candidatus Marinamargulisbacteria bacterium SCGC AG-410-N11]